MHKASVAASDASDVSGQPRTGELCPATPHMSDAELDCFQRWIPLKGRVLEFGSGGSTRFFCERGVGNIFSVESDPQWYAQMRKDPFLRFFADKGKLTLHLADIGPIRENDWGSPWGPPRVSWLNYHQRPWSLFDAGLLDFVLVDGRFRVACICQALLRCRPETVILVHDFTNRPEYHNVLAFVDVLEEAETTVVLRRKSDARFRELALLLQDAQFDSC